MRCTGRSLGIAVLAVLVAACWAWAQAGEEVEKLSLSFADTPVAEAAREMGELLERVVLVDEGVSGNVTLKLQIPKDLALMAVAATVGARPVPVLIFCSQEEAMGPAELDTEKTATLALTEDTRLAEAAEKLGEAAGLRVAVTAAVADRMVAYECENAPMADALDALAERAQCQWVRGYLLVEADPDQALEDFSKLPVQDQEKIVNQGLDRLSEVRFSPQQIDSMMAQGYQHFRGLSPEQRKQIIAEAAAKMKQMGGLLRNMSPQTQGRVRQAITPLVERGVSFFVRLDAREQAEFMPLMEALKTLE